MTDFFDPDVIRGDFESTLTGIFYPPVYSASVSYASDARARLNGFVYRALAPVTGVTPPSGQWFQEGIACKIIYSNVESKIDPRGTIKIEVSWGSTRDSSISCVEGSLRDVTGSISSWILTPRNIGTSAGLKVATRLREAYMQWNRIGTCGKQVKIVSVNGPKVISVDPGSDFFGHIMVGTIKTMERVSYLR
jgi:hypothetical protein